MTAVGLPIAPHAFPARTATELLTLARMTLANADEATAPGLRYAHAHLAALRAAAAVLAGRAYPLPIPPSERRRGVQSVWQLLPEVAPELAEWCSHYAGAAETRAAVEAGIPNVVTAVDADAAVQSAAAFVDAVEAVTRWPSTR